jgi:hypothetical protein
LANPPPYTDNYGYNTWLPRGAFATDPELVWDASSSTWVLGTSDHEDAMTNFCGVVASVMVLTSALEYRSTSTTVDPNGWVAQYFLPDSSGHVADANPNPTSKVLPTPLLNAYRRATDALDARACMEIDTADCMTRKQLQQVINFNILRSVDPTDTDGSNDGDGLGWLVSQNNFVVPPQSTDVPQLITKNNVGFETFRKLIRAGKPAYMRHTEYYAKTSSGPCGSGSGECVDITLEKNPADKNATSPGHYEALRGFSLYDAAGTTDFFFNNPGTGAEEVVDNGPSGLQEVSVGTYYSCPGGGAPYSARVVVTDPANNLPAGQSEIIFWPDPKATANRLCDLVDGDIIYVTTSYTALYLP